jgi:hypothetical protein
MFYGIIRKMGAIMYVAKLTGVWPQGVKGYEPEPGVREPIETKQFATEADAKTWLLGDGLHRFRWPIYSVEIFNDTNPHND